jgi:hypothetical protein
MEGKQEGEGESYRHAVPVGGAREVHEVRHAAYCRLVGWEDWCSRLPAPERVAFDLCSFVCSHPSHRRDALAEDPSQRKERERRLCCLLPLWHAPLDPRGPLPAGLPQGRYISKGGHLYACNHPRFTLPQRFVLVLDTLKASRPDLLEVRQSVNRLFRPAYHRCCVTKVLSTLVCMTGLELVRGAAARGRGQ